MSERQKAAQPEETAEQGTLLSWFLAGAVLGMVAGILLAPRSGRDTRDALSGTGRELYGRSREYYEKGRQFMDDAADLFERGRKLASGGIE
jgi:gas vesicle protein